MTPTELCHAYLAALDAGDLAAVLALFTPDAQVVSPLYGTQPADHFYRALFADTTRSATCLRTIFLPAEGEASVALHFGYQWTMANGRVADFDCVDVFALNPERSRFAGLTILYDTHPLRADFADNRSQRP